MPKMATKAAGNVFYQARMAAATWNDKLKSREGAAEITGIDRTRLAYIELETINPHPDEVLILADAYNAPELYNHFCANVCTLGRCTIRPVELQALEKTTLQLLLSFQNIPVLKDQLIQIAADGVIDKTEESQMKQILKQLDDAAAQIDTLKLFCQKRFCNWTN